MRRVWFLRQRRERGILRAEEEEGMFILWEHPPRRRPMLMEQRRELMLLLDLRRLSLGKVTDGRDKLKYKMFGKKPPVSA
jgi:hypothetical protein